MIGSLINKEGVNFLRTLSESESVELFSLAIIKHIINFLWIHFRRYIFAYSLVPYISYMILFLLYATYFHKIKYDNNYDFMESFGVLNDITNIILLFYIWYFFVFWNKADIISQIKLLLICMEYFRSFIIIDESSYPSFRSCKLARRRLNNNHRNSSAFSMA